MTVRVNPIVGLPTILLCGLLWSTGFMVWDGLQVWLHHWAHCFPMAFQFGAAVWFARKLKANKQI